MHRVRGVVERLEPHPQSALGSLTEVAAKATVIEIAALNDAVDSLIGHSHVLIGKVHGLGVLFLQGVDIGKGGIEPHLGAGEVENLMVAEELGGYTSIKASTVWQCCVPIKHAPLGVILDRVGIRVYACLRPGVQFSGRCHQVLQREILIHIDWWRNNIVCSLVADLDRS